MGSYWHHITPTGYERFRRGVKVSRMEEKDVVTVFTAHIRGVRPDCAVKRGEEGEGVRTLVDTWRKTRPRSVARL